MDGTQLSVRTATEEKSCCAQVGAGCRSIGDARAITVDVKVHRADPEEAVPLARLVAEAFHPSGASARLVPDRVERAGVR